MRKFVDYFVICGLDLDSGLEPDRYAGIDILIELLNMRTLHCLFVLEDNLHVSPLERSYKNKVLAHYPDNVVSNTFDASAVSMVSKH